MASLFASPDIAALVAAFPPPHPSRNQPSLVRSHSGNNLLNSKTVINQFRTLLEAEPSRIKVTDLPFRLGVERTDWLLECHKGSSPIRWSRSGTSLVPKPVWVNIIEDLKSQCQRSVVEIGSFAKEQDIEPFTDPDVKNLVDSYHLRSFPLQSKTLVSQTYLASDKFTETTRQEINSSVLSADDEKVNLTELFPYVPEPLLRVWAEEVATAGNVDHDVHNVIYVPSGFFSTREKKAQAEREARLQSVLQTFENDGYVQIAPIGQNSDTSDARELCERCSRLHADVETPTILDVASSTKVVILPSLLERMLDELRITANKLLPNPSTSSTEAVYEDMKVTLISNSSNPVLADLILKIPSCAEQVISVLRETILEIERTRNESFGVDFRGEVFVPAQLYAAGIDWIVDSKLKQNLNEYVTTYFRHEVIPLFVKTVREDGALGKDKSKMREIEKFVERSEQAKDIGELLAVMGRFAKKLKIRLPSEEEQTLVRRQTLERKVSKEIPKMPRASDILQNLVWTLLAGATKSRTGDQFETTAVNGTSTAPSERSNSRHSIGDVLALFMSPGKDTGRMIKQYAAMAPDDTQTVKQLADWREKLKSGSQTVEDLAEMKRLAEDSVEKMFADE